MNTKIKNSLSSTLIILGTITLGSINSSGNPINNNFDNNNSEVYYNDNNNAYYYDVETSDNICDYQECDEYGNVITNTGNVIGGTIQDVGYTAGNATQNVGNAAGNTVQGVGNAIGNIL